MVLSQDYEFQVLTYKALQDPIASPLKKPKLECASDSIIQEVSRTEPAPARLTRFCSNSM